jgi:hypothetical protein
LYRTPPIPHLSKQQLYLQSSNHLHPPYIPSLFVDVLPNPPITYPTHSPPSDTSGPKSITPFACRTSRKLRPQASVTMRTSEGGGAQVLVLIVVAEVAFIAFQRRGDNNTVYYCIRFTISRFTVSRIIRFIIFRIYIGVPIININCRYDFTCDFTGSRNRNDGPVLRQSYYGGIFIFGVRNSQFSLLL